MLVLDFVRCSLALLRSLYVFSTKVARDLAWDSGGSNGSNSYLMTGTRPKLGDGAPSGLPGRCDLSGPQIRDFNTTRTAQVLEEEGAVTEGVMEL